MSQFPNIQLPPDSTGKRSSQQATVEIHYINATDSFSVGDTVTTDTGLDGDVVRLLEDDIVSGEIYVRLNHGSIESVSDGEALKVDNVVVAEGSGSSEAFYIQNTNITGGNSPFNSTRVDDFGSLQVSYSTGDPSFDAFGKLQVSETTTIREYQPIYDELPEDFLTTTSGTASVNWNDTRKLIEMQVDTTIGDKVSRRTNLYHKYQTGVSTTLLMSGFVSEANKAGVVSRVGFFDDDDGLFFEFEEDGAECVVRSSTSGSITESHYPQGDWVIDRLDGSGGQFNISGKTLNPSKTQVMFIDLQWLGAGRVRYGFVIDGVPIVCHEINNANLRSNPYMRSGSLPITFEIENIAATASPTYLYNISSSVKCEGKFEPRTWVQGGTSEPIENIQNGQGLTIDITETVVDGILTTAEIAVNAGGTKYIVGDKLTITGGNGDAIVLVNSVTGDGIVDGIEISAGGTGYSDAVGVATTQFSYEYKPLLSIRASQLLAGVDNRSMSVPQLMHITDVSGDTDAVLVELVKNDTQNGGIVWLDPYPGNALESTNPTLGGLTNSTDGEVLYTNVFKGNIQIPLSDLFDVQAQVISRKADITAEPDHFTIRVKPATATGNVDCIAGMVWKEIR